MTLKHTFILGGILVLGGVSAALWGCQPSCDSIPTEALAQVRILNAVSNENVLVVYIDGKLFDSAYYDLNNSYYSTHYLNNTYGYRTNFISDGSPLRAGLHHIVARVQVPGQNSLVTIVDSNFLLRESRQSLIFVGKFRGSMAQDPRALYLNDVLLSPQAHSFARFIHAVPDINGPLDTGGLDVYFSDTVKPHPDLHIGFGRISHQNPGGSTSDDGTGLSPEDYVQFPSQVPGLLILPTGDANVNDAIVNLPYNMGTGGILATIVIRGEAHPVGAEPVAEALVLEDGLQDRGTFSYETETFGTRIVNAARLDSVTLLISSANDETPGIPRSPGYAPFSGQMKVTDIRRDSVSDYMALSSLLPWYDFWFGPTARPADVAFGFSTNNASDTFGAIISMPHKGDRWTFVAIDTIPNNAGKPAIGLLELFDTVSTPADTTMARVRFVNTAASYTASFTFAGKPISLKQRGMAVRDTLSGNYTIPVSNGKSGTVPVNFKLTHTTPITVFFMPPDATHPVPYTVSTP